MTKARYNHAAVPLPDGRILITGGAITGGTTSSAEIYDPATGTFAATAPMTIARSGHAAVALADGRVLVAGGTTATALAEIYDPATQSWTAVGPMTATRTTVIALALPDADRGRQRFSGRSGVESMRRHGAVDLTGEPDLHLGRRDRHDHRDGRVGLSVDGDRRTELDDDHLRQQR
jgi:hypothetical protein